MGGGTIGRADIYGTASRPGGVMDPLSVQNQNGASVAPVTAQASGGMVAGGTGPALAVLGLVLSVVMLRIVVMAAKD